MDWATKHSRICIGFCTAGAGVVLSLIMAHRVFNGDSPKAPLLFNVVERGFHYHEWARDSKRIRGEWNNNFKCWSDQPDCGKDYKIMRERDILAKVKN